MIAYRHRLILNNFSEKIKIKILSDLHLGSTAINIDKIKRFLSYKDDSNTYFLGNGDFFDSIVTTDKRYRKSGDGTETEEILDEQVEQAIKLFSPYKERIIGLGDGNHERTISKKVGTNLIKRLCQTFDVKYLGYSWFLNLIIKESTNHTRKIMLRGHHGWGGGSRTEGGSITKYSKDMNYFDADIYIYGHDHQLKYIKVPRLTMIGTKIVEKPRIMCLCGTFKNSYEEKELSTWEEEKGFFPAGIGGIILNIKITDQGWKGSVEVWD